MKKSLLILLACFYLVAASGITLNLHYCGGKLKEVSLFASNDDDGCCGNKKRSKGCCSEKNALIKVKDNHFSNASIKIDNQVAKVLIPQLSYVLINYLSAGFDFKPRYSHSPPVHYDKPIYLKNRVLII